MSKLPAPGSDAYTYPSHSGIDFLRGSSWFRKAFYASGPGVIRRLSRNAAGGNWVVVKYDAIPYEVGYCHMDNHNGCPRPGTRVTLGTRLGYVGKTGTRVTGPHIHVEILGIGIDSAVWKYFDKNRTVQAAMAGGGSSQGWNRTSRSTKAIQKVVGAKQDGIHGPETDSKIRAFQKRHGLTVDGIWGAKSDAKGFPPKPASKPKPKAKASNPFGIPWVAGLQKIANLNGGRTAIDQKWGAQSAKGFAQFLRANYGYKGNDVLGPVMWAAIARWLRSRWGYKGNDVPGPVMRAALSRAEAANYKAL